MASLKHENWLQILTQILDINALFSNLGFLLDGALRYVSENMPLLENVKEFIEEYLDYKWIVGMIIQAAHSYNAKDLDKLEEYVQFAKKALQVNSVFELLFQWRQMITKEGDLSSSIVSVIQVISIIDLSINLLSEDSVFEYIKLKRGEDLTIWKIKTKLNSK